MEVFGQERGGSLHTDNASMLENGLDLTHSMLYTRYPQLPMIFPWAYFHSAAVSDVMLGMQYSLDLEKSLRATKALQVLYGSQVCLFQLVARTSQIFARASSMSFSREQGCRLDSTLHCGPRSSNYNSLRICIQPCFRAPD